MAKQSERLGTYHFDSPHLGFYSLAVLSIAALVAALVIVLRGDGVDAVAIAAPTIDLDPSEGNLGGGDGLLVHVVLPGVGSGAPLSLNALSLDQVNGVSRTELTARRYATHLVADIVRAPSVAISPMQSADQVQVALTVASKPTLYRDTGVVETGPVSASVLSTRLGLDPGDPLPPFFNYTIQRGDTVTKLARRFGLEQESILFNNFELRDPDRLPIGGELTLPGTDGVVYTVKLGDTLSAIAENFAADIDDILAYEGNRLAGANHLIEGETILIVGGSASATFGGFAADPVFAIPNFRWPMGGVLTDFFGTPRSNSHGFHAGIDIGAPTGTFIGATAAGIVIQAGWDGSFGLSVIVDHGGGVMSRYAHLDHIDVFLGAFVEAGSLIGFLGQTGFSTGPHLHFEILMGGTPGDPLVWLNS